MKKIYAIIAAAAALVACTKAEEVSTPEIAEDQNSEITFNVNVGDFEPQTKAIKTGWEDGDVINLWFNDDIQEVPDLKMTYSNGKWTYGTLREGAYFNDSGYIKAIYESFNDLSNYRYDSGYFYTNHDDGAKIYTRHPMVLYTKQHTYTCSSNTVTADISDEWTFQSKIQIVVTGLDGDKAENYVLHCPQLRPINAFGLTERNATVSKGESGSKVTGVKNADGVAFYFFDNMNTTNGEYYDSFYFTLYEYSSSGMILSVKVYDVEGKSLTPTTQMCQGIKIDGSKFTMPEPEYVDLGLSVKWATFNVGAGKPEAYGDYYAWGETEEKDNYAWAAEGDYKWGIYDSSAKPKYGMTKYTAEVKDNDDNVVGDGLKTLQPGDDPATKNWGSKWRTPTFDEIKELLDNTKCEWTWDATKKGYTVKGLKTGKSIFLPAAGCRNGAGLKNAGTNGFYWSSSVNESYPNNAYYFYFYSGDHFWSYNSRYYGQSVRAVTEY